MVLRRSPSLALVAPTPFVRVMPFLAQAGPSVELAVLMAATQMVLARLESSEMAASSSPPSIMIIILLFMVSSAIPEAMVGEVITSASVFVTICFLIWWSFDHSTQSLGYSKTPTSLSLLFHHTCLIYS